MEQWFCGRFVNPCMGMKKTPKAFQNKAQGCEATWERSVYKFQPCKGCIECGTHSGFPRARGAPFTQGGFATLGCDLEPRCGSTPSDSRTSGNHAPVSRSGLKPAPTQTRSSYVHYPATDVQRVQDRARLRKPNFFSLSVERPRSTSQVKRNGTGVVFRCVVRSSSHVKKVTTINNR